MPISYSPSWLPPLPKSMKPPDPAAKAADKKKAAPVKRSNAGPPAHMQGIVQTGFPGSGIKPKAPPEPKTEE